MRRIYFDYAATTPVHPEVVKAMLPYFTDAFGNASSIYSYGQEAKEAVEEARFKVAELIGAQRKEIVFTSGGTEADNQALKGVALTNESRGNHIITTSIEHPAVRETCDFLAKSGFRITYLPVDGYGFVEPIVVKNAITDKTILVSIMHANNEIGTVEPVEEIGRITREAGVYFHTDAVQTAGHVPVDVNRLGVDLLSISSHKLYGPKGIGALYIRNGTKLTSFMHGGEQERGRRAGTQNVTGIVGFGKAAEIAREEMAEEAERLINLRNQLTDGLLERIDRSRLNGHPVKRLPNNVNISFDFIEGEAMLVRLDLEGICASAGSACSSVNQEPSHVLLAMGRTQEQARSSLRFSLGKWTNSEDVEKVLEVLPRIVKILRDISPLYKNRKVTANKYC